MAGGQIQWGMSFKIDKAGLNDLKTELLSIQKLTTADYSKGKHSQVSQLAQELKQIKQSAAEVQTALDKSFNTNLGTLNVVKFNQELKKLDINKIAADLSRAGTSGQSAFRNLVTQTLTTNLQLKETHKLLDSIATSMKNTIQWGVTSSVFNTMTSSIERAWNFSKSLDTSLNSIRIVTGKSADEMERFAIQANKASQNLGRSTKDYTDASLIYYQQGLGDAEVAARTETTLKAANVTGQTGAEVSEQLTAVWNGYKVAAEETELYIDKLAAVAANSASDLEELSTGISKVASAAKTAGVDIDELTAQVATIVSVTREAPETVGSSLKTIYARLGDLKVDGVDEFGVSLGKVSQQLEDVGVKVLDESGDMRDMGDIITDLAAKWDTWTAGQKQAVAVAAAGKMQYTRLMTLMENWDMYRENLETSQNAMGTLQEQQDIYMERTQAHLQQLSTAWERVWNAMSDSKSTRSLIDVLTELVTGMANFTEAVGGGGNALLLFGSIGTQIFSKQIAQGIATMISNFRAAKENATQLQAELQILQQFKGININDSATRVLIDMKQQILDLGDLVSSEQHNMANSMIQGTNELQNQKEKWDANIKAVEQYVQRLRGVDSVDNLRNITKDSQGNTTLKYANTEEGNKQYQRDNKATLDALYSEREAIEGRNKDLQNYEKILTNTIKAQAEASNYSTAKAREEETSALIKMDNAAQKVIEDMLLLKDSSSVSEEQAKSLSRAIKDFNDGYKKAFSTDGGGLNELPQLFETLIQKYREINGQMDIETEKFLGYINKEMYGATQTLSQKISEIRQEYNNFINNIQTVQIVKQITEIVGAFGSLASAIQTIGNLTNIWDNDDLSTGEKFLQTFIAIGTAAPMVFSNISKITEGIEVLRKARAANIAITTAETEATVLNTGAVGANTAAVNANKLAFLTHPIGIILVAITTVIGGIIALSNAIENNTKELIKNNQETIKNENSKQKLIDKNKELFTSLEDINTAMKEGSGNTSELSAVIQSIIDNYDDFVKSINGVVNANGELENSNGEVLTGLDLTSLKADAAAKNYDKLSSSAIKAQKELARVGQESARQELRAAGENIWTKAKSGKGYESPGNYAIDVDTFGLDDDDEKVWQAVKNNLKGGATTHSIDNGGFLGQHKYSFYAGGKTPQDVVNLYDTISAALASDEIINMTTEQKSNSEVYQDLSNWIKKMNEDDTIKQYREAIEDSKEYAKELNKLDIKERNAEGQYKDKSYEEIQQSVVDDLKQMQEFKGKTDEELKTIADIQLQGISDEIDTLQNNYLIIQDLLKNANFSDLNETGKNNLKGLNSKQLSDLQKVATSDIISDNDKNNLKNLLNSGNLEDFSNELQKMTNQIEIASSTIGGANTKYTQLEKARKAAESDSTLDAEDYNNLNNEIKKYFSLMADGTYKMTGDAEDFYKVITSQERQGFKDILAKSTNPNNNVSVDEIRKAQTGLASTAISIDDLAAMLNTGEISSVDYKANQERVQKSKLEELDLDFDTVDVYAEQIEKTNKNIQNLRNSIADTNDEAEETKNLNLDEYIEDVAVAQLRLARGAQTVSDNWKEWSKILKDTTDPAYAETLADVRDALADLTNSSAEYISNDTVANHLNEIHAAAKGDTEALWELQQLVAQDYLVSLGIEISEPKIAEALNQVNSYLDTLRPEDLQVGAVLDDANFINGLNNLAIQTGMTTDQMSEYLGSLGMDADLETHQETVESTMQVPSYTFQLTKDGLKAVPSIEEVPYTHTVDVPTIKTTSEGGSGVRVVSGGNFSKNSAKKGFNKGASGSGGKKGGGSDNKPDKMDLIEDEKDRYHDIDIILKQISTDLDRLDKQKDKLFGKDLLDNLNKQLQTLDRQIDATNEKIRIAQGEAAELRNKLSGYGTTFNANGTIANYAQVYQSQLNYVNSLIAQYNSMSKEQQEAFKDTVETAKENFDKFTEAINNYDTLISDTIPGLQDEIQDAIDKEIEIKIEEFTMEIEIRLDLSEAERDWNEFKRKVIDSVKDDDILGSTKARLRDFSSYYKSDNTGEVQSLTQQVLNTKAQLDQMDRTGISDWYGDNRAKALEDLKSYTDQLMESLGNVEDLVQEIKDSYLDMMDEAAEKFGDQIDLYEQVRDIITHDMNVIELVYGEESYKDLEKYYEKQEENYNRQLDFNRQQKDFWYNQMIAIEKAGGKNSEAWLKAKENWMSAVNEWNSAIEGAIENLQDKYQNAINLIFQNLNDKVTGGLGLEYVSEEWELINQNADQYLDTINSLYGIQDLENKYLDAIDNTDSISAQQKLNELMEEEVTALKEKDKLTQYDIDRANMKYEIALKQIALEEAQQNKSTMRLRRDSQGNYTYQYVADNDQVGQIEDELSALKNELYNFDLEHYRDNLDQVLSIYTEFQEKMAEAALINDPEERQERELLLREQYGELINGLVEQNEDIRTNLHESAFTELADLYGIEYANFQQLSEDEKTVMMEQMIPQWDSAVQHMTDTFAGNDEGEGGFLPTCRDAFKQLDDATKQYQTDLGELQQSAGTDFDNIRNGIDENIGKTQELITNNDELIRSYQDQLSAIGAVISELQQLVSQYNAARDAAIAATEAAYGYWKAQQQQAANAAGKNVSSGGSNSNSGNSNSNNNNNSSGSGLGSGESGGGASVGNKITYSGKYYYDSFGTSPAGSKYSGVADGVTIDIVNNNPYGIHVKSSDGKYPDLGWIKKSQVTRWNTGGYTGDWGDDSGRLAILDRKELVLNKEDTPNILNAVEIMRGIANSMNLSMLSRMAGSINGVQNSSNSIAADSDTLEQNVHIDATFPGVKDAREIEQALNNLVNVASQRVGHNRR